MNASPQPYDFRRKKFFNPHIADEKRTIKDALLWKFGYFDDPAEGTEVPQNFRLYLPEEPLNPIQPQATWINHSTFLIKIDSIHILTDPIWGRRCSPVNFLGPIRRHEPALKLEELEHVEHVLISHNHYDHLDKKTVQKLHALYPYIYWWVPLGVKAWFIRQGITNVQELGWWQTFTHDHLRVTAVPAQHFSGRTHRDTNRTLWVGWVLEFYTRPDFKRLYFVGDTGYNPHDFKAIGSRWSHMDLSLIPIGSYVPRKFMSPVHIDPEQAVLIHTEVSSQKSLGMHWNTFNLSDEKQMRPCYDLLLALEKRDIPPSRFLSLPPGHPINW